MDKLLSPAIMALVSLASGAGFFTFVLAMLRRTDINRRRRHAEDRLYEIAFRLADGHCKMACQYGLACASAYRDSKKNEEVRTIMLPAFLEILSNFHGELRADGEWIMRPYPDFLSMARIELQLTEPVHHESLEKEGEK